MEPLTDLTNGLQVLESFLIPHGFTLDNFENGKGSGGQFTIATYKKGQKKFIIGYRFSIGELGYQFNDFRVGHTFYLAYNMTSQTSSELGASFLTPISQGSVIIQ